MAVKTTFVRRDYHGNNPVWKSHHTPGKLHGIELEVEANSDNFRDIVSVFPEHDSDVHGPAPVLERDASLCTNSGVEIIFPPISPAVFRQRTSYYTDLIDKIDKADVVSTARNTTGMHVNVNKSGWSRLKAAIFVAVIHNLPIKKLEAIGGRTLNGYCRVRSYPALMNYTDSPAGHHAFAAEHKTYCIECRFPGSTTSLDKIQEVTSFLSLLEDFAEETEGDYDLGESPKTVVDDFMEWMEEHPDPEAEAILETMNA